MKPMYKGVGLIALATGATVLAINLLGGEKKSDSAAPPVAETTAPLSSSAENATLDAREHNATTNDGATAVATDVANAPSAETATAQSTPDVKMMQQKESVPSAPEAPAAPTAPKMTADTETNQGPPPGLFQESSVSYEQATTSVSAPVAPMVPEKPAEMTQAPAAPEAVVTEVQAPVAPEAAIAEAAPSAPESPDSLDTAAESSPAQPAIAAEPAVAAESAAPAAQSPVTDAKVEVIPPPPMPNLENIAVAQGQQPAAEAQVEAATPQAEMSQAEMKMPAIPQPEMPQVEMKMPAMPQPEMPQVEIKMPAMPDVSRPQYREQQGYAQGHQRMQQAGPGKHDQNRGMGMMHSRPNGGINANNAPQGSSGPGMPPAAYMPRVYYVPVPMMPYGQMPYGGGYPMYPMPPQGQMGGFQQAPQQQRPETQSQDK